MAKIALDQMFTVGLDMSKVAEVLGCSPDRLTGYRVKGEVDVSRVEMGGHLLNAKDLNLGTPKICPECIQKHGFILAWTDLKLIDACPNHQRMLLTDCPNCGRKLSWFRPGILRCRCGADLSGARGAEIMAEHAALLSQVVSKVTGAAVANPCSMPVAQFEATTLRGMLVLVESLVRFDRATQKVSFLSVAASGGWLLSRWPENLFSLLRELVPSNAADSGIVVMHQHLARVYRIILRKITVAADIFFLREIIGDFSRTLKASVNPEGEHATTGLAVNSAESLAVPERVSSEKSVVKMESENSPRQGIPRKRRRPEVPLGERTFGERDAAERIGLPASVLQSLRRSGHFKACRLASRVAAFHEADIIEFEAKIRALHVPLYASTVDVLSLGDALNLKCKFGDGKGELIAAVFEGRLSVIGSQKPGLRGLLLDRLEIEQFIAGLRAKAFGGAVTPSEVAKLLHCDPLVVPALLSAGYLEGRRVGICLRITRESVNSFGAEFRSVAAMAKGYHTRSYSLTPRLSAAGINLLMFERGYGKNPQPFVRIAECENFEYVTDDLGSPLQNFGRHGC
jgi:hypothetical protein